MPATQPRRHRCHQPGCDAAIFYARIWDPDATPSIKSTRMPIDADTFPYPDDDTTARMAISEHEVPRCRVLGPDDTLVQGWGEKRGMTHFATCAVAKTKKDIAPAKRAAKAEGLPNNVVPFARPAKKGPGHQLTPRR